MNPKNKEIQTKIVYYGPAAGGKTTNLQYLHHQFQNVSRSKLVTIPTCGDSTVYFDFMGQDFGKINGYNIRVKIYTIPGEVRFNATKQLLLKDVDGIVFIADSVAMRREKNFDLLRNLQENLAIYNMNIFKIPLVFQYNKRDREDVPLLPLKTMEKELNGRLRAPSFEASAISGKNVVFTLESIVQQIKITLENELNIRN